jgi:hypothetical protein
VSEWYLCIAAVLLHDVGSSQDKGKREGVNKYKEKVEEFKRRLMEIQALLEPGDDGVSIIDKVKYPAVEALLRQDEAEWEADLEMWEKVSSSYEQYGKEVVEYFQRNIDSSVTDIEYLPGKNFWITNNNKMVGHGCDLQAVLDHWKNVEIHEYRKRHG